MAQKRKGKAVDTWKQKTKYKILAPKDHEYKELGVTMSNDPQNLVGRTIEVSMRDITGDKAKQHQKLVFELTKAEGTGVHTKFKEYNIARSYLRSLVREGMSKIDFVKDISVSDAKLRVKVMITTRGHAQATQKKEIIKKISGTLHNHKEDLLENFVQLIMTEKLGRELHQNIKNICPVGRLEIAEVSTI
jgi:small subunit ribosomal protein S3Ae